MRSRRTYACMQCAMRKNVCMQLKNKTTSMQKNKHTSIHALSNETCRNKCRDIDGRLLVLALFLSCQYQIFQNATMRVRVQILKFQNATMRVRVRVLKFQYASTSTSTDLQKCEYASTSTSTCASTYQKITCLALT